MKQLLRTLVFGLVLGLSAYILGLGYVVLEQAIYSAFEAPTASASVDGHYLDDECGGM